MKVLAFVTLCILLVSGQSLLKKQLKGEDMRENVELFMQNFFLEAFALPLPILACDHDSVKVQTIIVQAFDQIKDGLDFEGIVKAALVIATNKDALFTAFQDCEQTLIVFKDAIIVLYPLTDSGVAVSAAKNAALHNPISFTRNLNRAKSAIQSGDWAAAGTYAGKNVHLILEELPEDE